MPTLELAIDARKAEQGARQAETALRSVTQQATQTERAFTSVTTRVDASGSALNAAFSATSGGLSVTRGIATAAAGMQQLNVATVGFAAATALLDASRLANDFRSVASTATKVSRDIYGIETVVRTSTGAWATFGAVLKAHPILTIATVVSAAAALMSTFSENTRKASDSWKELGTSLGKSRIDEATARFLGVSPKSAQQSQLDAVFGLVSDQRANPRARNIGDLASQLGVGEAEVARFLASQGNTSAFNYVSSGSYLTRNFDDYNSGRSNDRSGRIVRSSNVGAISASPEQIQALLGSYYRNLVSTQNQSNLPNVDLVGTGGVPDYLRRPGSGPTLTASPASPYGTGSVLISDQQRGQVEFERATRQAAEAEERMQRLVELGQQFGASVSDAFFNVASGAQDARQAIAALVSDLARAASRQAFSSVFGAVVGATANQTNANNQPVPGGG